MNYELANQLKNAGFPQKSVQPEDCLEGDFDCEICGSRFAYNPNLSELIAACGDKFAYLAYDNGGGWRTRAKEPTDIIEYGKTPEEAVANLYLALKKRSNANV